MDQRKLAYFSEVCKTGSISHAAKNLGLTPQAIAKAVSSMENELGMRLLDRSQEGSFPTEVGKEVCRIVERMRNFEESALAQIRDLKRDPTEKWKVTIGLPGSFLQVMPPEVFTDFAQLHTECEICVKTYPSLLECAHAIVAGEVDFGFCEQDAISDLLESVYTYYAQLYVIVGRHHHLADRGEIDLSDLSRENVIMDMHDDGRTWISEELLRQYKIKPRITLPVYNDATKRLMVLGNNYVALSMAPNGWLPYGIVRLNIRDLDIHGVTYFSKAKNRSLSRAAQAYMDFIVPLFDYHIRAERHYEAL